MVVVMVTIPIAMQVLEIEVITLHGPLAILDHLDRALIEGHRGQAWQSADALLAPGIAGIDLHLIHIHGDATEAADRIHHEKRAMRVGDALQLRQWLQESRGGFRNGGSKYFGIRVIFKCLFQDIRFQGRTQFCLQVNDIGPGTLRNLNNLAAKKTETAGYNSVTLFEKVTQNSLGTRKT